MNFKIIILKHNQKEIDQTNYSWKTIIFPQDKNIFLEIIGYGDTYEESFARCLTEFTSEYISEKDFLRNTSELNVDNIKIWEEDRCSYEERKLFEFHIQNIPEKLSNSFDEALLTINNYIKESIPGNDISIISNIIKYNKCNNIIVNNNIKIWEHRDNQNLLSTRGVTPSAIHQEKDGSWTAYYHQYGIKHRKQGPAVIVKSEEKREEKYYLYGFELTREYWEILKNDFHEFSGNKDEYFSKNNFSWIKNNIKIEITRSINLNGGGYGILEFRTFTKSDKDNWLQNQKEYQFRTIHKNSFPELVEQDKYVTETSNIIPNKQSKKESSDLPFLLGMIGAGIGLNLLSKNINVASHKNMKSLPRLNNVILDKKLEKEEKNE